MNLWNFIKKLFTPLPEAPCVICGELTKERNSFSGEVRHDYCAEKRWNEYKLARDEREKIDLYKKALKEHEAEKLVASCTIKNEPPRPSLPEPNGDVVRHSGL